MGQALTLADFAIWEVLQSKELFVVAGFIFAFISRDFCLHRFLPKGDILNIKSVHLKIYTVEL